MKAFDLIPRPAELIDSGSPFLEVPTDYISNNEPELGNDVNEDSSSSNSADEAYPAEKPITDSNIPAQIPFH